MWQKVAKCGKKWQNVAKCGKKWQKWQKVATMAKIFKIRQNGKNGKKWHKRQKMARFGFWVPIFTQSEIELHIYLG